MGEFRNGLPGGDFRVQFAPETMNVGRRNVQGGEEGVPGNFEIAVGAFGEDAAFIGPEKVDVIEGNRPGAGAKARF